MKVSLRTKNRIREHRDHGWSAIGEMTGSGAFFPGERVILFECPCDWIGWIPKSELEACGYQLKEEEE